MDLGSLSLWYLSTDIQVGVDCFHEMSRRTLLYLERSKQLPLTITFYTQCYDGESLENFPRTTWKLLLSCSERWERADLSVFHELPVLDLLRCKMSIIKSLRLCVYASYFELYHPFAPPPCLTEIDLRGLFGRRMFPWSQLTKVKISFGDGVTDANKLRKQFYHS